MNESLLNNIITFLITISSSGLIGFYFKRRIERRNSITIEGYKGEVRKDVELKLESHKGDILKNLEEFKDANTKENLESSRFVEVICRQRIEWLEKVRNEVAFIVSTTRLYIGSEEYNNNSVGIDIFKNGIDMISEEKFSSEKMQKVAKKALNKAHQGLSTKTELIKVITTLKLRLNFKKDLALISFLDKLSSRIESGIEENIDFIIKCIVSESQRILKEEWNQVKEEVVKGYEIES